MRPLARWTFGCCNSNGEESLRLSVRSFKRFHPEFDQIICYNNVSDKQLEMLKRIGVNLHCQTEDECPCKLVDVSKGFGPDWSMPGWGWKLCPLRLRPGAKELWVDNDIVFRSNLACVDTWLSSHGVSIISSSHKCAYGDMVLAPEEPVCAGFFGVPETSEFVEKVKVYTDSYGEKEMGYWDEQAIVASVVLSMSHMIIPMSELMIVKELSVPFPPALHFIGLNRTEQHLSWNQYKCYTTLM